MDELRKVVILISAGAEWRAVLEAFPNAVCQPTPYGGWFTYSLPGMKAGFSPVIFMHGGWGKIAAAASTGYAIQRWQPFLVVNLGTCGGFAGHVERGEILLVEETLVYDIIEQMGDPDAALAHYATRLNLDWLPEILPQAVRRARLVSADRDILPQDIPLLNERFGAVAADWESGAIAWVASQNRVPCLILRGVSDLVASTGSEAYGSPDVFQKQAVQVMTQLLEFLPGWILTASQFLSP
jgi:adenosylhomocysteine nucleosidase